MFLSVLVLVVFTIKNHWCNLWLQNKTDKTKYMNPPLSIPERFGRGHLQAVTSCCCFFLIRWRPENWVPGVVQTASVVLDLGWPGLFCCSVEHDQWLAEGAVQKDKRRGTFSHQTSNLGATKLPSFYYTVVYSVIYMNLYLVRFCLPKLFILTVQPMSDWWLVLNLICLMFQVLREVCFWLPCDRKTDILFSGALQVGCTQ